MIIGLGYDEAGYSLKHSVANFLSKAGFAVHEFGHVPGAESKYSAHYAQQVCHGILTGELDRGVLICGTGTGISIAANKVNGIRAVVCSEPVTARLTREFNGTNVIAFGSFIIGEHMASSITEAFLTASFRGENDPVYEDRYNQITAIEQAQNTQPNGTPNQ